MVERTDADWLARLTARDEAAVGELRDVLCRGLVKVLAGRGAGGSAAEDFAQEACLKVLDGLPAFRGDSRFLTWALAVATRVAFSELRKARYRDVSLNTATVEPIAPVTELADTSDRDSLVSTLRRLITTELTDRQRALVEGELAGVPQVVLAERLGTNRNAMYKLGHDARMKLKKGLEAAGVTADGVRAALAGASH
ncbi:MAG: sigma-70 family RNA polymerase sigma factor [Gemmataceae bacterium]|nr:sigma-70 family RNA polymerase sigma factor [Gemmataceae bacterium]